MTEQDAATPVAQAGAPIEPRKGLPRLLLIAIALKLTLIVGVVVAVMILS